MKWFEGKRVVVPFDYSEASLDAVKVALKLAERPSDVHVVHVLMELPATDPIVVWHADDEGKRRDIARASMEKMLSEQDLTGVEADVLIGVPAREIAALAEKIEAGMIVIPSQGYTGLKRFLLGSVAEHVVRHAPCSVLVLKPGAAES